ncbi:MAG: exodeoxyribonuclease VII large subunit [Desulfobacteraceae bacterium]|nr:exodeoxyribonuclease VII large subunit [Desulfobacteraceae bacterium]
MPMRMPQLDEESGILTVSKLNEQIRTLLEGHFPFIWVRGEISNFRVPSSGHFYFTLKDEQSQIHAVFFRGQNRFLNYRPEAGMQVICQARLSVYEPRGEYQIIVEVMEPLGAGSLQLAFEALKKRLLAEGLFDPARKKPMPLCPRNVCIATSRSGAAVRDILKVFERSPYPLSVSLFPVAVQGAGAKFEIVEAIEAANVLADKMGWDLLIVGRGGGSLEDLWAFNEEIVARAIAGSALPVVSAVGHEIDYTISDMVADMRCPTPTAAAEWVVGRLEGFDRDLCRCRERMAQILLARLESLGTKVKYLTQRIARPQRRVESLKLTVDDRVARLCLALTRKLETCRTGYAHLRNRLVYLNPEAHIGRCHSELDRQVRALTLGFRRVLDHRGVKLQQSLGRLDALSPLAVLSRGYAIAYAASGDRVIRSYRETSPGERIAVRLFEGRIDCEVLAAEGPKEQ